MVKKKKRDNRIKRTHKFQLNINRDIEAWLHEWIPILTKERKFSQYVRDGLSIMIQIAEWGMSATSVLILLSELREGKRDKLYEMFPHLREDTQPAAPPPQPMPPAPNTTELAKEIATQIILQGGADKILMQSTGQQMDSNRTGQGAKMLTQQQFALPTFDDDEAETQEAIAVTKNTTQDSAANFLNAAMALR